MSTVENQDSGGLLSIASLPSQCGGGQVGMTPLLHFLYKSPTRAQVLMPAFAAPLDSPELQQVKQVPVDSLSFTFLRCLLCIILMVAKTCFAHG